MARRSRTPDHSQTLWKVSRLSTTNLQKSCAHQEDTETDEYRHGINEWLAHKPAFSRGVVSGWHFVASDSNDSKDRVSSADVFQILCLDFARRMGSEREGVIVCGDCEPRNGEQPSLELKLPCPALCTP